MDLFITVHTLHIITKIRTARRASSDPTQASVISL